MPSVTIRTRRSLPILLCLLAGHALAQAPIDIEQDFAPGTHKRFAERVNKGQASMYAEVLAAYDARLAKHPDDVSSSVERCRFIQTFAYSEDMVIESAGDDLDACRDGLEQGPHAKNVDVILYGIESSWDEANAQEAQALIPASREWTRDQQATLYELLTDKFQWKQPELGAEYAMRAVSLKPGSRVLITAAQRYVQLGAKDRARRLLVQAPASTWDQLSRFSAAQVLIDMGDPKAAAALLKADKKEGETHFSPMLARILAETGEIGAARDAYRGAIKPDYVQYETRVEYFEFERQHGNREQTIAAYDQLRDQGFGADILGRQRLSLLFSHPTAPWSWRDVTGFLLLGALLLANALVPLIAIAPVHYRGLARRVAGLAPDKPEPRWTLRHSWYALGVVFVGSAIALYVFTPAFLEMILPWTKRNTATSTDIQLGKQLLVATLLGLLLVAPLLRGRSVKTVMIGRWSIVKSIFVGLAMAIGLKIAAVLLGLGMQWVGALGTDTTRAMQGVHQSFGLAAMLLVVAVAVPFVEELVFRGVLLEAFRGQVTFFFASIVQAAAFAALHESWSDMPSLFVFGLASAWLAKRSEGLLASITMHGVFNLMAAMALVGITSILNR
jgi:CAAX protease family protein